MLLSPDGIARHEPFRANKDIERSRDADQYRRRLQMIFHYVRTTGAESRLLFSQIVFLCAPRAEERVADCNIRTHVIYTGTAQKHARSGRIHFVARNCCCPAA